MKLNDIPEYELETMNYDDIAYIILKDEKQKMKINELFKKVCDALKLPEELFEEKIADFFNVDTDYLLGRTDRTSILPETIGLYNSSLNKKDEKDIEKILDHTREQLLNQEGLMFDGNPATPEAVDSILSAMQIGMEMAKKKNKEKYTPKKYKKD